MRGNMLHSVQGSADRARQRRFGAIGVPKDAPQVHSTGVNPDRILLFGTGPAIGLGSTSWNSSLPGELARGLTATTGRGADVDVIASPGMSVEIAITAVSSRDLERYDAVVVLLGVTDALALLPVEEWTEQLDAFSEYVVDETSRATEITFVAIEPASSLLVRSNRFVGTADAHARLLNAAAKTVAQNRDRLRYLAIAASAGHIERPRPDRETVAWATAIAAELAPALDAAAAVTIEELVAHGNTASLSRQRGGQDEEARVRAVARLHLLDSAPDPRIDDIVERAQKLFGTTSAAFTLLDGDRQWNKSISGSSVREMPRARSICETTIQQAGPFIVPDTLDDDRFDHLAARRFYAGFPVESPDGERIGALCVFDVEPREASTIDQKALRDLALELQNELWRYEPAADAF